MDFKYRPIPMRCLSRSPPKLARISKQINLTGNPNGNPNGNRNGNKRFWILILRYLTGFEILSLSKVSRFFYLLSYDKEIWKDQLAHYDWFYISNVITQNYKTKHIATGVAYEAEEILISNSLPRYVDEATLDIEEDLYEDLLELARVPDQQTIPQHELENIPSSKYRQTTLLLMQLSCMSCLEIGFDLFKCPIQQRYICRDCLEKANFRMLSLASAGQKYRLSPTVLKALNIPYVEVPNPKSINFATMKLHYDFQIRKALEKNEIHTYTRRVQLEEKLRETGHPQAVEWIYGKIVGKYLDGELGLEKAIQDVVRRYSRQQDARKNNN